MCCIRCAMCAYARCSFWRAIRYCYSCFLRSRAFCWLMARVFPNGVKLNANVGCIPPVGGVTGGGAAANGLGGDTVV
jgi:hypothetical protein